MAKPVEIQFRATIHDTAAALRFGGDGALVTFAVPESDKANAVALAALLKTGLVVMVRLDAKAGESDAGAIKRTAAKKRV